MMLLGSGIALKRHLVSFFFISSIVALFCCLFLYRVMLTRPHVLEVNGSGQLLLNGREVTEKEVLLRLREKNLFSKRPQDRELILKEVDTVDAKQWERFVEIIAYSGRLGIVAETSPGMGNDRYTFWGRSTSRKDDLIIKVSPRYKYDRFFVTIYESEAEFETECDDPILIPSLQQLEAKFPDIYEKKRKWLHDEDGRLPNVAFHLTWSGQVPHMQDVMEVIQHLEKMGYIQNRDVYYR